jgi:2-aminoadipate transaminase
VSEIPTIRFGGGLPDPSCTPPLADLFDAVLREDPEAFTYDQAHLAGGGVWGYEPLRSAIAARLAGRSGARLGPDNVVLVNGGAGAIELIAMHHVHRGTVVAVEELTYPTAVKVFRRYGATIVTVPVDADGLRVDVLADMVQAGPAPAPSLLYTIATAQSPTGTTLTAERRAALASLAAEAGLTIVQDDTYGEVIFDLPPPQPLIGLSPDQCVHIGSFSKTLAPGLRLGWISARTEVCQAIAQERTDLGQTPIVQHVVGRFFAAGRFDPHLAEITASYRHKRDVLCAALERDCSELLTWSVPQAGFFLWSTLRTGTVEEVARFGSQEGVGFVGGPYFSPGEPNRVGIRLAYSELSVEQLEEGSRRLAKAIERTRSSTPGSHRSTSSVA